MSIEISERVMFLNRIHLFYGLTDEQIDEVAKELKEVTYPAGREILKQGTEGDSLYLIWSGKVTLIQAGNLQPLGTFIAGDHLGEEDMLVRRHPGTAAIMAASETTLLVLKRDKFQLLIKKIPSLKTNFSVAVNSYRLERRIHFKWLQENEVVHFMARKHSILLLEGLMGPVILEGVGIVGMVLTWWFSLGSPILGALWYVCLFLSLGAAGWGVWNFIDWGNDYYLVTDRRVVWVEKVIGIYESRQEAPLSAIQRVNVESDITGRMMDYGDLLISTIVGSTLKLKNVDHPYQAAALIDQYWKRSKDTSRKMEVEEINAALRTRLLDEQKKPDERKGVVAVPQERKNPYEDQRGLINLFRLRFENQATVTYRKHILVLLEQTWKPVVILFILLGFLVYEIISPTASLIEFITAKAGLLSLIWALLFFVALIWGIYEYVDWSNDIFQVTPDQILDIDKTPLGQVTNDIASLDNILSIEYKRKGLLELIFNYGTVFITIGGGKEMAFENVFNPSAVQEDIERRRLERITKKEQETIKAERERTADWFAAYFHNEQQLRREENAPGDKKPGDTLPMNDVK
jgi:hypothetical protein